MAPKKAASRNEPDQFKPNIREEKPKNEAENPNDIDVRMRKLHEDHVRMGVRKP